MVPNKWDDSRLDLCILGEFVKPLHKKIFSKLIFVVTFAICYNHIYLSIFLGIIHPIWVIIDDFIYCDNFLLCWLDNKHARIFLFYYLLSKHSCFAETYYKLSMLSRYVLYHLLSEFCEYACHCEIMLMSNNAWVSWYACFIVWLFPIKYMLGDILFKLTVYVLW